MSIRMKITASNFDAMRRALARPEEVVFAYATFADDIFSIVDFETVQGADVESRSDFHVTLADEIRPRLIKAAADRALCMIEAHSHGPCGYAQFSPTDLTGFAEWVPHVRWRLAGRPYAALVMAGTTWDALAWVDDGPPQGVTAIDITSGAQSDATITPTNATAAALASKARAW